MKKAAFLLCLALLPLGAQAAGYIPTTAARLSVMCDAYAGAMQGKPYDMMLAKECEAYLSGFLDSLIVAEAIKGGPLVCSDSPILPGELPLVLRQWMSANMRRAQDATAAVALFGALSEKYPCRGRARRN
ncbi:MAG: Rap1a/Tai family immunity protein [Rickettsiales bacterium]